MSQIKEIRSRFDAGHRRDSRGDTGPLRRRCAAADLGRAAQQDQRCPWRPAAGDRTAAGQRRFRRRLRHLLRPDRRRSDAQELHETARTCAARLLTADGVGKVEIAGVQENASGGGRSGAAGGNEHRPDEIVAALGDTDAAVEAGGVNAATSSCACAPAGVRLPRRAARAVGRPRPAAGSSWAPSPLSRDYAERPQQIIRHNGQPALTLGISGCPGRTSSRSGTASSGAAGQRAPHAAGRRAAPAVRAAPHRRRVGEQLHALNVFLSVAIVVGVLCIAMGLRAG